MSAEVTSLARLGFSLANREALFGASAAQSPIFKVVLPLRRSSARSSVKLAYESGVGISWPAPRYTQRHRRRFG